MNNKTPITNREGLTWEEWFHAAYAFNVKFDSIPEESEYVQFLYKAWSMGEDPTEYRNVTTHLTY